MNQRILAFLGILALLLAAGPGGAQTSAIVSARDRMHPVIAHQGMVASQEARASEIGLAMLRRGGHAVDAAVAIGFALAVTLPRAGNLGGGGFMLVHDAESGRTEALDYREMAPAAARRDMYLDADGNVDKDRARYSHHSVGVPGTVAGMLAAHARFGRLPLAEVMAPAITLARDGMAVSEGLAQALTARAERLKRWPDTARIFFKADGESYQPGERLRQADLAWSLQQIAEHGADAFYRGVIAQKLAAEMSAHGGPMTATDLATYRVHWRVPVQGVYRGYDVRAMPPPSSGGVHLVQILNLLEAYPLRDLGHNGADSIHLMAEAMKLAYADRAKHLGDPEFWSVPVAGLTDKGYAARLRTGIDPAQARPSSEISAGNPPGYESNETTHFSVVDSAGNAVSNTYTLNFSFGTGIVAAGTGILLNNEMDDFSAKPGVPNAYGLVGGEANAIEAGKRPLSSMTPTIVLKDGKPWLVTGSPGGSRIITTVLQLLVNVIDHDMNIAEASAAVRVHHQWLPDTLFVERGLSPDTLRLLAERGHKVVERNASGSTQTIMRLERDGAALLLGAADPRRIGALAVGY